MKLNVRKADKADLKELAKSKEVQNKLPIKRQKVATKVLCFFIV